MDTQNPSVRPHAQSRTSGKNHPRRGRSANNHPSGVVHDNTRHATRSTVIGNHLAQHPDLSALAIGLAVYIQSVPTGAPVGIKTLADRFPESPARIAAALRELETHGYLRRTHERTESGRIVTRTVSCNQPGRHRDATGQATGDALGETTGDAAEDVPKPSANRQAEPQPKPPIQ
ncbi:hypothetical protein [Streptomyces scabiei]|uniref:hypothetical protein n=1 Tax=Streptomyces scabiei TaxID=1930 RepID=UPI0026C080B3|nr:hypothetical protein [Streptomyces scabiei]